nr:protein argonaute 2-like [Ipomoea batatas]
MESSKVGDKISKCQVPKPANVPAVREARDKGRKTSSEETVLPPFKQDKQFMEPSVDYSLLSINGDISCDYSPLSINGEDLSEYSPLNRHPNEKVEDNFAMVKGCGGWLDEGNKTCERERESRRGREAITPEPLVSASDFVAKRATAALSWRRNFLHRNIQLPSRKKNPCRWFSPVGEGDSGRPLRKTADARQRCRSPRSTACSHHRRESTPPPPTRHQRPPPVTIARSTTADRRRSTPQGGATTVVIQRREGGTKTQASRLVIMDIQNLHVFRGLQSEYRILIASLTMKSAPLTIPEVADLLSTHQYLFPDEPHSSIPPSPLAFFAHQSTATQPSYRNCGRGRNHRGQRGRRQRCRGCICYQICDIPKHTVLTCYW